MAFATLGTLATSGSAQEEPVPFTIAREFTLSSTILGEDRPILVSLPAGYDSTTAAYPVLYLLDGRQNMMHVAGSVEVLSRTGQVPKMIIVGIPSLHRERDLTPSAMAGFDGSGGGLQFLDFIARELMPYIDQTYRTHPYSVLEGHSLGGTLTVYALLHRPELFDAYIIMSPALWWNHEELTEQARSTLDDPRVENKTIFFGIGEEDGWGMRQELKRFVAVLAAQAPPTTRWDREEFEGEGHMSAPLLANYFGLKMVFSDLQLPDDVRTSFTEKAFLAHESAIAEKYGAAAAQTGESYVTLGFQLMEDGRYHDAVTVLRRDAEVYDRYPPSFRWLAEAQEKSGDLEAALESYERALALSEEGGQGDLDRANVVRLRALLRRRINNGTPMSSAKATNGAISGWSAAKPWYCVASSPMTWSRPASNSTLSAAVSALAGSKTAAPARILRRRGGYAASAALQPDLLPTGRRHQVHHPEPPRRPSLG